MRARSLTFHKENKNERYPSGPHRLRDTTPERQKERPVRLGRVLHPGLGFTTIYLRCEARRDYFYVGSRQRPWGRQFGGPPCATWSGGAPEKVVMRISGHKTREVFTRYNIVSETRSERCGAEVAQLCGE